MKLLLKSFFCFLLALFASGALYAQGKTDIFILGKDKGAVDSIKANGTVYLDVQKTARKLGASVELFAQAKQAKISMKGFYAILTAPLNEIIVNAQTVSLKNAVIAHRGKIMAPAAFFELPAFQNALDRDITFSEGKMWVEKRYNLAYQNNRASQNVSSVVFETKGRVPYESKEINKHTVQVTFPGAVLKRDLFLRVKNGFIRSLEVRQNNTADPVLEVILDKNAKAWNMAEEGGKLVFRAGHSKAALASVPAAAAVKPADLPAPSLTAEDLAAEEAQEMVFGEKPKITAAKGALKPSVIAEAPAAASEKPVIKPAPAVSSVPKAKKKMRIVVDPGHGGKDAGAVRKGYREKVWNLAVGKELYRLLYLFPSIPTPPKIRARTDFRCISGRKKPPTKKRPT